MRATTLEFVESARKKYGLDDVTDEDDDGGDGDDHDDDRGNGSRPDDDAVADHTGRGEAESPGSIRSNAAVGSPLSQLSGSRSPSPEPQRSLFASRPLRQQQQQQQQQQPVASHRRQQQQPTCLLYTSPSPRDRG